MKINNRKEIAVAMYGFFFLILLDILFLILAKKFIYIPKTTLYIGFLIILLFCIWKIIKLKNFSIEVSEHIFSIKYNHPLLRTRQPVLEVPIQKIIALKTEKNVINYILVVSVNTKRGIRNFYYRIGQLPENQFDKFKKISEFVRSSYVDDQSGLKTIY